uniref:Recep_L_domain domain-containing protein n=1 Tax=Strongyloides papillosus TaxID=174720 RepID=A0A0N5CAM7_STREA
MNSFAIIIFILTIPTLSSGFFTYNCEQYNNKTCEILLTPFDDLFKNVFLPTLDALTQFSVNFGITGYENDPKTILGQVNDDLKEKKFVEKLSGVKYKNPTQIELIADYDSFFIPDHLKKTVRAGLNGLGPITSRVGTLTIDSKNSTAPEVTTTISTITSLTRTRAKFISRLKITLNPSRRTYPNRTGIGPITSRVGTLTIDSKNSTAPEVTTTISTITSLTRTRAKFISRLKITLNPSRRTYPNRTGIGFFEINRIQKVMNSFAIIIFILTIPTLSSGFFTYNCEQYNNKTCEILLTPFDDLFKNVFLPTLDALTQFSVNFGITGYENDPKTILGQVNDDLKEVNQTTIAKKLSGVKYKNPTQIELIADYDSFFIPDHLKKTVRAGLNGLGPITSRVGTLTIDSKNSTAPEVTTTISTITSLTRTRAKFISRLKITLNPSRRTYPNRTGIGKIYND